MAKRTVRPLVASSCIVRQNSRRAPTSIPAVGSSRMSRFGSGRSASAKRSRCCSPPESFETRRLALSASPERSRTLSTGSWWGKVEAIIRTVSRAVRSRRSPPVWRTAETLPSCTARRGAAPKEVMLPLVGSVRPRTMSRVVVLPAPLGPRMATTSPGSIRRSTPATAWTVSEPERKLFLTSRRWIPSGEALASVGAFMVVVVMPPDSSEGGPARHPRMSRVRNDRCHGGRQGGLPVA